MYFSNTKYEVLYHLTKFETKTQFVNRKIKKENSLNVMFHL
jgi:hypothetical protein